MAASQLNSQKPQLAIMNAVHDLPVLVARDEGFFRDEDLDIEFVTTRAWRRSPENLFR